MPANDYVTDELIDDGRVARIPLDRPDARNAPPVLLATEDTVRAGA